MIRTFWRKSLLNSINTNGNFPAFIFTSSINRVKEINIVEDDNKITIEGRPIESDRKENLIKYSKSSSSDSQCACPLCRLNLKRLAYSDILILSQFTESNGRLMMQHETGVCNYSYKILTKLVKQAQSAQLLPRPPEYISYGPWDNLNHYYEYPQRIRDRPKSVIKEKYWQE